MTLRKHLGLLTIMILLAAGCSAFPGLRVISGEDTGETAADTVATSVDLVMADKTGNVDTSVLSSADRIESAAGNVDIVEIYPDITNDTFMVFMMWQLAGDPNNDPLTYYNSIRRAVELTWQGTLRESAFADRFVIEVLAPQTIPTLDNGPSFIAFRQLVVEVAREDMIDYLSRPHNLESFIQLIVDGKMSYAAPEGSPLYLGQPNHPLFMVQIEEPPQ
jgi:hypothetical protein